jgi:hypothetical protein
MLRILAFFGVLMLVGMTGTAALAAQDSKNSYPYCYNAQKCASECAAKSVYKGCELICQRMASTKPACK